MPKKVTLEQVQKLADLHPVGMVDPIVPKGAVFVRVGIKP
jgi:hypothetical protein